MGLARQSVKQARRIKPRRIAKLAEQRFTLLAVGADESERDQLAAYFVPLELAAAERDYGLACWEGALADDARLRESTQRADLVVFTPAARARQRLLAEDAATLDPQAPEEGVADLLRRNSNLLLALGRRFPRLRPAVARALIQSVAMRNAALAALSAVPEVVPTPLGLAWAIGEFASDTVVLTSNQIRLALQLAAVQGEPVGWFKQSGAILLIVGGAFGWRALARTLVSLAPAGVGLAAKSGIAYAGTMAVGRVLWHRAVPVARREPHPGRLVLERLAPGRWQPRRLPNLGQRLAP